MKAFFRRISPVGAVKDFANEFSRPTPRKWHILALSAALTFMILMVFIPEDKLADPERPSVTYITSYAPGRTDDEIMQSNIANQQRQDERRAELERREERRKELYRALGQATGLDTDEMEREIAAERAAEEAAEAAAAAPSQGTSFGNE